MKIGELNYIYRNGLNSAHDVAYSDSKDLPMATNSDNILKDRAYEIGINPKYDGHQRRLASSMYNFFDKKQDKERQAKRLHM